jgi:hypothetical protein
LDHIEVTSIWSSFKHGLSKEVSREVFFPFQFHPFFLNLFSFFFYWSSKLPSNQLSQRGHIRATLMLFNLKPRLYKKLVQKIFYIGFIFFFFINLILTLSFIDGQDIFGLSSQLGHVRATSTQFNFKFGLGKELNKEVSKLNC